MNKIQYHEGQLIGPHNIIFVKEIEPNITPGGTKQRKGIFLCLNCQQEFESQISKVKNGTRKYCLSCSKIYKGKKYIKDLTGQRFDKLLVLELLPERKHDHTIYKCLCDCGKITNVARGSLVRGLTHSCGAML